MHKVIVIEENTIEKLNEKIAEFMPTEAEENDDSLVKQVDVYNLTFNGKYVVIVNIKEISVHPVTHVTRKQHEKTQTGAKKAKALGVKIVDKMTSNDIIS